MRDIGRLPRRVQGRQAIEQSLRRLLIRVHRFGQHRAVSGQDRRWAARAIAHIQGLLDLESTPPPGWQPRSVWEEES